jgi:site-specific recombinase XerD
VGPRIESRAQRGTGTVSGVKLTPKAPLFVDRRGDRLKRGGAHYLVERSYRAAGLSSRVPAGAMIHALRHLPTRLAEDGASATEIQALLGDESLNTSQGYIDATASATRQTARANRIYRALQNLVLSQPGGVVVEQPELG